MSKVRDHKEKFGHKANYNDEYDANYCQICDIWLDDNCGDEKCHLCNKRPELPNMCEKN